MRIPVKRYRKEEVKQAGKDLEERGFKCVVPMKKVSSEGAFHKKSFYIAYYEKVSE